ncbi:MAG: metallophosphoesterase [Chitinispirillales bacterium]|nr:metallophosphoesterase [Chitinispirillales bacterium]
MSTYIIGDIHGCFTQFDELRTRIEANDPNAVFILIGDIVARGPEDDKMLDWAYNNITPDGKYQMVLGNHDDGFIAVFGKGKFETVYSLDNREPPFDEFEHLKKTELMYKYAAFLSKQPLVKEVEVGGQKFVIVHAWYEPEDDITDDKGKSPFKRRYCLIWERFIDEYSGKIKLKYKPAHNEKLIHGHTPTLLSKDATCRSYSPGKVWDMGGNIDIDCGLVFNVNKRNKYGNLAAYNLETGKAEYLFDIADGYADSEGEYLDDKLEREEKERLELQKQKQEAAERAKPYLLTFYKQVFDLDELPAEKDSIPRCEFNFLGDYIYPCIDTNRERRSKISEFDFENDPMLAMIRYFKDNKHTLYLYCVKSKCWSGVDLDPDLEHHAIFRFDDRFYLLSASHSNPEFAEIAIHIFQTYKAEQLLYYKTKTPSYNCNKADHIMANDIKIDKVRRYNGDSDKMELNGLITCDFYDDRELFTVKILKSYSYNLFIRVLDSQKNVLAEIRRAY